MANKHKAIKSLKSDAKFILIGNDLTWLDGNPTNITEDQINKKLTELQEDYNAKQYQRNRKLQYPSWQEQMDMQYHDTVNGTTTWKDAITKVKLDNPKD